MLIDTEHPFMCRMSLFILWYICGQKRDCPVSQKMYLTFTSILVPVKSPCFGMDISPCQILLKKKGFTVLWFVHVFIISHITKVHFRSKGSSQKCWLTKLCVGMLLFCFVSQFYQSFRNSFIQFPKSKASFF